MLHYIYSRQLKSFFDGLAKEYSVYISTKEVDKLFYRKYNNFTSDIVLSEGRTPEPLKSFFTPAREKLAEDFTDNIPNSDPKPFCIAGAKSCDVKGFKIQDYVFCGQGCQDPFYVRMRENNLIISFDCISCVDTCFCLAVGVKPYPEDGFDINFSKIDDGFIIETGSEKGEKLVHQYPSAFGDVGGDLISQRSKQRENIIKQIENNIKSKAIPCEPSLEGIIEKNYESNIWENEAKACVECGACTAICPACHCFLLYDQNVLSKESGPKGNELKMKRLRAWDSCLLKDYARVAGGANPRPKLWMRLRNRFEKKFDFFPKVAGVYACTGCGRCVSACPAKIDIREVLKKLAINA